MSDRGDPSSLTLRDEFVEGTLWTAAGRYSSKVITFAVTAILSRVLAPRDFGVVAMVVALTAFASVLAEAGIGSAVVQKDDLDAQEISSVFWLSLAIGGGLALVIFAGAPLVGALYRDPRVVDVTRVLSVKFLFLGVVTVPLALLQKQLRFREIAGIEAFAAVLSGSIAILMALQGFGYWALVVQLVASFVFLTVGVGLVSDWRPGLILRGAAIREVLSYSSFIVASRSVNYWSRHADDFLVGRVLGADQLGYYEHAYKLMMLPLQVLSSVTQPTLHPILVTVKDDVERLRRAYLELTEALGLVSFPLAALLAVVAGPLVRVVWGPDWEPTVGVFRILAFLAAFQPVVSTAGSIFLVRNRTPLMFGVSMINMIALVFAFVIGLSGGIEGVALGFGVAYLSVVAPITFYVVVLKLLDGNSMSLLRAFVRPAGAALLVGAVSKLAYEVVVYHLGPFSILVVVSVVAAIAYLAYIRWVAWDRVEILARTRLGQRLMDSWSRFRGTDGEKM